MENNDIKPEDCMIKHLIPITNDWAYTKQIIASHREYAQLVSSTLSEELRDKDRRIEELEKRLRNSLDCAKFLKPLAECGLNHNYPLPSEFELNKKKHIEFDLVSEVIDNLTSNK